MGGFQVAPVFLPIRQPLQNGNDGDVLTIVAGERVWAPGGASAGGALGAWMLVQVAGGAISDWDPSGFDENLQPINFGPTIGRISLLAQGSIGSTIINNLVNGADGQLVVISNSISSTNNITFVATPSQSQPGFICGANVTLSPGDSIAVYFNQGAATPLANPYWYVMADSAGQPRTGSYLPAAPNAGAYTNYNPTQFGSNVGRIGIEPVGGDVTINSFIPTVDGHELIVTNLSAFNLTLGSTLMRLPSDITLVNNMAQKLVFNKALGSWCMA